MRLRFEVNGGSNFVSSGNESLKLLRTVFEANVFARDAFRNNERADGLPR